MWAATAIILTLVSLLLTWSHYRIYKHVHYVVASAEESKSCFIEKSGYCLRLFKLDRLTNRVNQLVSENVRAAAKGQAYLDQIEATLGNLREAVIIVDDDHFIRLANRAFRQLIGRSQSPTGQRLETFIQGPDFIETVRNAKKGPESARSEVEVYINHDRRWLELSSAQLPRKHEGGESLILFVLHDITRQKKLERMRTEFVANVSHELRTPVTVIKGFAETLEDDYEELDAAEQKRFLRKIRSNSDRLNNLIQDLLLLTRLELEGGVLRLERKSVSALLRECAENFESRLDPQKHRIEWHFAEGKDILSLDPLRISQVATNLLENILRHAKGFSCICIRTRHVEEGVISTIEDNGAGIPAKDLPHIFQRFYRVDKGRSRESGGTGLGLSIVKHIVQQHGGDLKADSTPGAGTRMSFFLPYAEKMTENAVLRAFRPHPRFFKDHDNWERTEPTAKDE